MTTVQARIITKTVDIKDTRTISSASTGMVVKIRRWAQPLRMVVAMASIRISSKTSNTRPVITEITTKATTKTRKAAKVRGPPCLRNQIKRHSTARVADLVKSKACKDSDHSIATTNPDSSIPIKRGKTITIATKISSSNSSKLTAPRCRPTLSQSSLLVISQACL